MNKEEKLIWLFPISWSFAPRSGWALVSLESSKTRKRKDFLDIEVSYRISFKTCHVLRAWVKRTPPRRIAASPQTGWNARQMLEWIQRVDGALFIWINRYQQNPLFDVLMPIISDFRYFAGPFALIWLFFFLRRGQKARWLAIAFALLIGFTDNLSSKGIKPIIRRPRPYYALDGVHYYKKQWHTTTKALTTNGISKSFPSTHATNNFAGATFLIRLKPKLWPLLLIGALAVGYSRVYLGVHYPFDVLAGAVVGMLCALAALKIFNLLWDKRERLSMAFKRKPRGFN